MSGLRRCRGSRQKVHIERSQVLLINKANKSRISLRSGSVYSGDRMWTLISGSICQANVGRKKQNSMMSRRNKNLMMSWR